MGITNNSNSNTAGLGLEALDPTPDVHALFSYYNSLYFDNQLGACSVEWSTKRMTLCAGVCHFSRSGGCRIKLSEPLLKFRPVRDLKDTLLHEMIHAALFLGNVRDDGDHGPRFRALMTRINQATCPDSQRPVHGYNITVYHTMHDEVNNYRTHVWRCTRCGNMVRRSMNRPPQEADCRSFSKTAAAAAPAGAYCRDARCLYHGHVRTCGGAYEKIAEPEKQQAPSKAGASSSKQPNAANKRRQAAAAAGAPAITSFFPKQQQQQQPSQGSLQQPTPLQNSQHAAGSTPAMVGQQQQQQSHVGGSSAAESSKPPDPRAAAAAAALARAGGSSAAGPQPPVQAATGVTQQHQHHQQERRQGSVSLQQQQQRQTPRQTAVLAEPPAAAEVVELLSSEEDEEPDGVGPAAVRAGSSSHAGAAVADAPPAAAAVVGQSSRGVCSGALMCPVCCLEFSELGR